MAPFAARAATEGYYPLQVGFGTYVRSDSMASQYDGLPEGESTSITFDDTALKGYLVVLPNGQVTGHWMQDWFFTTLWSGIQQGYTNYSGLSAPTIGLTVDVTGAVTSEDATTVTLQLNATVSVAYDKESTFTQNNYTLYPRLGPSVAAWSAMGVPVTMTCVATRNPDGSLVIPIPTIDSLLPAVAAASPAGIDGAGTEIRYLAWPQTSRAWDSSADPSGRSDIPGLAFQAIAAVEIGAYRGGPTLLNFEPPKTDLQPVFPEYYLLDVAAPYGFIARVVGPGDAVQFRYGTTSATIPLSGGRAVAPFDYGDAATAVEADLLQGGTVLMTLNRPLQKITVPDWAAPASAWSALPGVSYSRTLNWPVSLAASRALSGASILTGLWGVTGSAESEMKVVADSIGTPTEGTLEGKINFHAAGQDIGFTLGGEHLATLNGSGLSLTGKCETSSLNRTLLEKNITPLSLIPGAETVLVNVSPIFRRIIRGSGLALRSNLTLSASGDYAAGVSDTSPRFTSGSLVGTVDVSARLNILPQMFRDLLYAGVEGGGGLAAQIQLFPNVAMTALGGHLYYEITASFFGLSATAGHDYTFGDSFAPAPAAAPQQARLAAAPAGPVLAAVAPLEADLLPPAANIAVTLPAADTARATVVTSLPVDGVPAPAAGISIRNVYNGTWSRQEIDSGNAMNIAPTIGSNSTLPGSSGTTQAIVWSYSAAAAPMDAAERETFANSMELRFQEYRATTGAFVKTPVPLTNNALCDFGPSIPQVTGLEPVRVFWARSNGSDFTGITTPLTLLTRGWFARNKATADEGWTAEAVAVSGLSDIVDWKAIVRDTANAAIIITRDTDGDLATTDDSELWLAREDAGVWSAPVQVTSNAVPDEHPVMFYEGATLHLAWQQAGAIVHVPDVLTGTTPTTLLPATVQPGAGFALAYFAKFTDTQSRLLLAWPRGDEIVLSVEGIGAPVAGGSLPEPRPFAVDGDTITGFHAVPSSPDAYAYLQVLTLTTAATAGSTSEVPARTQSRLSKTSVDPYNPEPRPMLPSGSTGNQTLAAGGEIRLQVDVQGDPGATFQWYHDGKRIRGATSATYVKPSAEATDAGTYTLHITSASGTIEFAAGTVTISELFAAWIGRYNIAAPFDTREADADSDGVANDLEYLFGTDPTSASSRPATYYQPRPGLIFDTFTFTTRAASTDCDFAIEYSGDLQTWYDVRNNGNIYLNRIGQTLQTTPSGTTKDYVVWLENAATGIYPPLVGIDFSKAFMRVRMIRP